MGKIFRKAQTVVNQALLWSLVSLAFFMMFGFIKASLQGRMKKDIDSFSNEQFDENTSEDLSTRVYAEKPSVEVKWYK